MIMRARAPAAIQYIAKGLRVFALKYRCRNVADAQAATAAESAPMRAIPISWLPAEKSSGSLSAAAAPMMGVAMRKEYRSASSWERPTNKLPVMVDPVRE